VSATDYRHEEGATEPGPRVRAFVRFLLRRGTLIWILAVVLAVPAAFRAAGLYIRLRSDIEELLPRRAASVAALDELRARMPGLRYLGIVIDTGTAENVPAANRFIDDLAARVRAYPSNLVARVKTGVQEERQFLETHVPLYMDVADLETIRMRLEAKRDAEVSRAMGLDLGDESEDQSTIDLGDIEAKYKAKQKQTSSFEDDRFASHAKRTVLMVIQVAELTTGADLGKELFRRVHEDIGVLGGLERYAPGMRLGYSGDIAIEVEELAALVQDLTASSIVVIGLVLLAIGIFYRWAASLPALLLPLLLGAVYAFAFATLPLIGIEHLNSNTAFLGSVIVGNGINFGIILVARYVEERRHGRDVEEALVYAVSGSRIGTFVAALAAAAAYGSLALTQFRGFRQFGVIGGFGMLICWATAFVLAPPLIAWLDRGGSSLRARPPKVSLMDRVAELVTRRPAVIVSAAAVITALALVRVQGFGRSWIEYDFSKLRRADSHINGEAYWGRRMDDLLGRYLTPLVMLSDSADERQRLERELQPVVTSPPLAEAVDSVVSIDDVVPKNQAEKIAVAEAIRADLTPRILGLLSPEQRNLTDQFLKAAPLRPITAADLPVSMTSGLRERDGTFDKALLIYPRPSRATWQGEAIAQMTNTLRKAASDAALPNEKPARLAGSIPLSADIISSIEHDAPIATAASLLGVTALVVLSLRHRRAMPLVIGSLLLGVLWLLAAVMALGVKINFANFIAFPITFGIGIDYAVNVVARYLEQGSKNIVAAIRSTGRAVTLCSVTTVIGYSSLLFAQNRALFLFGVVAVLGEVACLLTAILVLPSVLLLLGRLSPGERAELADVSRP
jgi:predicted RND superfamily exporter protein